MADLVTGYTHVQEEAKQNWNVTHSLGLYPTVSVRVYVDGSLVDIIPNSIRHVDKQSVEISFTQPFYGEARFV